MTSGWVSLERTGRSGVGDDVVVVVIVVIIADAPSSFVRSGAMCLARPGDGPRTGPGTPFMEDVSEGFKAALRLIDFGDERGGAAI